MAQQSMRKAFGGVAEGPPDWAEVAISGVCAAPRIAHFHRFRRQGGC